MPKAPQRTQEAYKGGLKHNQKNKEGLTKNSTPQQDPTHKA